MTAHHLAWELERGADANGDPSYVEATVRYRYGPGAYEDIDGSGRCDYLVGPDVEVESVVAADGAVLTITDDERRQIEDHIIDDPPYLGPDPDDARDLMIEDRAFFAGVSGDD